MILVNCSYFPGITFARRCDSTERFYPYMSSSQVGISAHLLWWDSYWPGLIKHQISISLLSGNAYNVDFPNTKVHLLWVCSKCQTCLATKNMLTSIFYSSEAQYSSSYLWLILLIFHRIWFWLSLLNYYCNVKKQFDLHEWNVRVHA